MPYDQQISLSDSFEPVICPILTADNMLSNMALVRGGSHEQAVLAMSQAFRDAMHGGVWMPDEEPVDCQVQSFKMMQDFGGPLKFLKIDNFITVQIVKVGEAQFAAVDQGGCKHPIDTKRLGWQRHRDLMTYDRFFDDVGLEIRIELEQDKRNVWPHTDWSVEDHVARPFKPFNGCDVRVLVARKAPASGAAGTIVFNFDRPGRLIDSEDNLKDYNPDDDQWIDQRELGVGHYLYCGAPLIHRTPVFRVARPDEARIVDVYSLYKPRAILR